MTGSRLPVGVTAPAAVPVRPMVRTLDLVGSVVGLLVTSPLWPLIAAAIKVNSRGPVLYRGTRLGAGGTCFEIFKFRSMRVGLEAQGAITVGGDARVTTVGRVLRATKLDELPQLLNVLRGEMSLVGPRPEAPRYLGEFPEHLRPVLRYRPGITGPASLSYRHEEAILATSGSDPERYYVEVVLPAKAVLDLEYCRRRTARSDLVILLRTAASVARLRTSKL